MPSKPAARLGDTTAHGTPIAPGPGAISPPVLINGKPALRGLIDSNVCPIPIAPPAPAPHGPEKCVLGSMTVLINGKMAVRQGDIWIAAGPPNQVALGSLNVNIGDIGFGLLDPANMKEFCADFAKLVKDWNALTPAQRQQRMADALNKQLGKSGVPAVGVNPNSTLSSSTYGQFDFPTWNVDVNSSLVGSNAISTSNAKTLANTIYHEARHTEQWWQMARTQAATSSNAGQLSSQMGIPPSVANTAMSNPMAGSGPEAVMGQAMNQSVYGADSVHRGNVLNNINQPGNYDKYRALPEEQDAWHAGDSLPCGK